MSDDPLEWFSPTTEPPAPTDGPERLMPWRRNPRGLGLPHGMTVGQSDDVQINTFRRPAIVSDESDEAAAESAAASDQLLRPAGSNESLRWRESVRFRDVVVADGSTSLEIARLDVVGGALVVVEQLATYLNATPLDEAGEPAGPAFVTGCCVDPRGPVHPTTSERLIVRWSFFGVDRSQGSFDGPSHFVDGVAIQLATSWNDLRFAWGSRYTEGLQLEVPPVVESVRLVATPDQGASSWSIAVGGRLVVWSIAGGPRGRALTAATSRTT